MAWMIPNELSDIVAVKSSLPTPSTEECFYWPQERQWVPERLVRKLKAAEKKQLQGVKAIVQKAASGQSKCRKCGGAIAKGTLRVGYPTSDPRGAYEVLCCWLHVGCSSELFSMFLQREAEGNLVDQLREDLIVSLTCLESSAGAAAERTAKAEVENGGVKAPPVEDPPPVKKEDPQIRRTRVSSRCSIPNKAEEQDKTDENKEAPSVASTAAPRSTGSSASASSNADDASSDSGGPTNSGGHKVDNEDKKEEALSTRDRLLLERSSCIISTERLCLMADDLSSCEQHRVQEALAEAARRLFFPTEVQAEALSNNVAAEEVIEKLVKREIKGRVASPEGLLLPLLPFQEEGLWWLTQQETSHIKGGILADEMGMGKTIQIISLLLCRPFPPLPQSVPSLVRSSVCSTLIVTPLAALLQWKSELDRFVVPGRLSVLIYHGSQRRALHSALHQYDVVLTTYQTVEQDFRKQTNKHKVPCEYCHRLFMRDKLLIHQKYFCGPDAQRTAKQRLTERKVDEATERAMVTLNIINAEGRERNEPNGTPTAAGRKQTSKKRKNAPPGGRAEPATFVPTPGNCLKELLQQANIDPDELRPMPWLGPHGYRNAKATAETAGLPQGKKRKVDSNNDTISSSREDSADAKLDACTDECGKLGMAEVACLKVAELKELIKALGGTPIARAQKAQLLEQVEPLLKKSLIKELSNPEPRDSGSEIANLQICSAKPQETDPGMQEHSERQGQAAADECQSSNDKTGTAASNKSVPAGQQVERPIREQCNCEEESKETSATSSSGEGNSGVKNAKASSQSQQCQRSKRAVPAKQGVGKSAGDEDGEPQNAVSPDSSSSSRSKPPFKYVKPVKPDRQQADSQHASAVTGKKTSLINKKTKTEAKNKTRSCKNSSKTVQKYTKPKKHVKKEVRRSSRKQKPAERNVSSSESEWESSSTAYEPSSSSSESGSSDSFVETPSDDPSVDSESDVSSVVSVRSSETTKRRRAKTSRNSSNNSKEQPRSTALTPIDELLWGKALGETESEDGEEGGHVKERLEEDPQLVEALRQSPLHGVVWQRIVLDEAHRIKSRNSSTAQAIFALRSATVKVVGGCSRLEQRKEQLQPQVEEDGAKSYSREAAASQREGAETDDQDRTDSACLEIQSGGKQKRMQQKKRLQGHSREDDNGDSAPEQQEGTTENAASCEHAGVAFGGNGDSCRGNNAGNTVVSAPADNKTNSDDFSIVVGGCRWCLTGTPLQNRVGELYSLVRFLRFYPYAYYFCSKKGCSCRSMHYRFADGKYCEKCSHTRMTHYSFFCRRVVKPIKEFGYQGEGIVALETLKKEVLDVCLLRRTKIERAADVKLPPLVVSIRRDALSPQERDFYEALFKQTATQFDSYVKSGTVLHNFAHIFDLLSRLRQAVDHPYLLIHGSLQSKEGCMPLPTDSRNPEQTGVCAICQEDMDAADVAEAKCGHAFHHLCIQEYIESAPAAAEAEQQQVPATAALGCPACFVPLTIDLSKPGGWEHSEEDATGRKMKDRPDNSKKRKSCRNGRGENGLAEDEEEVSELDTVLENGTDDPSVAAERQTGASLTPGRTASRRGGIMKKISASNFTSSTKIEALVQELQTELKQDATVKSIVFSQFCAMLDLIEFRLKREGIHCAQLTGSMTAVARSNVLYAFNNDSNLKVILISLKAGGEGLNLQVASRIYLMDPWWNPAAEMQAIQRAHRIGQTRPVKGVRFICTDTIEERILQLQEKKQLVFDGTVGASNQAMHKLTQEDLRFLFQS